MRAERLGAEGRAAPLAAAQDLNVMQANAWIYWQAIENSENGNWWGLLQARTPLYSDRILHACIIP
jgi:hypothetical protein